MIISYFSDIEKGKPTVLCNAIFHKCNNHLCKLYQENVRLPKMNQQRPKTVIKTQNKTAFLYVFVILWVWFSFGDLNRGPGRLTNTFLLLAQIYLKINHTFAIFFFSFPHLNVGVFDGRRSSANKLQVKMIILMLLNIKSVSFCFYDKLRQYSFQFSTYKKWSGTA